MCYSFVMLAQKSEGPAGGTWPVGWPAFGSWFCFWVLLSAWRWCKSVWLVVKVMCSNLSSRLGCDSPLFFIGLYHIRSITLGVFVWNLIKVWICHLESVFLILFYYWSRLRVVLCGANGFGNSANKPHFLCLGCSGRRSRLLILKGSCLGFLFFYFFIFVDANTAPEIHMCKCFQCYNFTSYILSYLT